MELGNDAVEPWERKQFSYVVDNSRRCIHAGNATVCK